MRQDEPTGDELADYRPVSPLAVATLVCGGASALVLVTPLAAMLPLLAMALAMAAFADLRRAEGKRAGRPLVLVGLALAVGFTAQALAGATFDGWVARRRATATATAWIEAVCEQRWPDALAMCGPNAYALPHEVMLGTAPPSATAREEALRATAAVAAVEACGGTRPPIRGVQRATTAEPVWNVLADLASCGAAGRRVRLSVAPRSETTPQGSRERWLVVGFALEP